MNFVGPFPKAAGNKRWLLVSTDYFIKWVEDEPLAKVKDVKFVQRGDPSNTRGDSRLEP